MFKVSVLPSLYTLIDDRIEYRVRDRLSISFYTEAVAETKRVWLFR